MKPSEYLKAARAKIDAPEKWTQFACARDANGNEISYMEPKAVCFCSSGAFMSVDVTSKDDLVAWATALKYLQYTFGMNIVGVNDSNDYDNVMQRWDQAIASAEAAEHAA